MIFFVFLIPSYTIIESETFLDKNSYFLFDEESKKRINFYRGYMVNLLTLVSVLDYFPLGIPINLRFFDFFVWIR